jgi:hypothetical protein
MANIDDRSTSSSAGEHAGDGTVDRLTEKAARRLIDSFDEPERHLDAALEMIPYVDGTLDAAGREIVETHVEDCAMCRAELEDLRRHAAEPARDRRAWPVIAAVAAAGVVGVTTLMLTREEPAVAPAPSPSVTRVPIDPAPPAPVPAKSPYANASWAKLVASVLEDGKLPVSKANAELRESTDTLRGGEEGGASGMAPSGIAIETTRPTLRWKARRGASYVASIFEGEKEIESSRALYEPRWRPQRSLARGRIYQWQVEVVHDGTKTILPAPPAPPAKFRVIGAAEHEELVAARAAHPDDALLLAALHAKAGLDAEAKEQLGKLQGSGDPQVQRLLAGN